MDFIQTQTESLPLCALATLWKWAKSVESKNIIYFVCFHRQSLRSVTFGSLITIMNVHGFQPNSNRVTPTMCSSYPVKMIKIWGIKKYHLLSVFTEKSLRSVTFGSLITSMNVHGFQPNLAWSIPTVPSFIPVNMGQNLRIQKFHLCT